MLKKSKVVALLAVCVMMFATVEPALAWGNRTGSQTGDAVAYGAGAGAAAAIGAAALIFFTGGLATPIVMGASAAVAAGVAGAAGGAYYGYNVEEKSLVKDAAVIAGAGAGGAAAGAVATGTVGTATIVTGVNATKNAVLTVVSNPTVKAVGSAIRQGGEITSWGFAAWNYFQEDEKDKKMNKLLDKLDKLIDKLSD